MFTVDYLYLKLWNQNHTTLSKQLPQLRLPHKLSGSFYKVRLRGPRWSTSELFLEIRGSASLLDQLTCIKDTITVEPAGLEK